MKLAWSKLATDEMRALRDFSIDRWGTEIARRYLSDVRAAAKHVAAHPEAAKSLRGPLRLMRVRSHYLIVHVDAQSDRLTIARVLHTAMDLERHLPVDPPTT